MKNGMGLVRPGSGVGSGMWRVFFCRAEAKDVSLNTPASPALPLVRNAHTGDEMDNLSQLTENTCSSMSQRTEYEYSDSQPQFSNSAAYVYNTPLALQIDEEEDEDNVEEASDINMLIRQTRASPPEIASNPVTRPLSTAPEHRTQPRPFSAPATLQQSPRLNSPSPKSLSAQPPPPRVRAPARESSAFQPQVPVQVRQTPPQPKKRKQEAAVDQAVSALQTLVKRSHDQPARQEQESSENDFFFQMLAKKVEKLPEDIQDTLRLEFHMKVVEETRKLRGSCVAPPPASENVHDV
ncbi:hypothetical protein BaRGS_00020644 [Batillaria attramentaria]|uniref:BESS domain-containing protein n=1 Tax=Batillaria attramentaria TaxID=370345 RepID=A0ABD0KM20_9CAEN